MGTGIIWPVVCDQANGVVSLYIDGVLQTHQCHHAGQWTFVNELQFLPGLHRRAHGDQHRQAVTAFSSDASVANVALYPYPLSSSQVRAHYNAVPAPIQIIQLTPSQLWQRMEFQIINVPAAANPFDLRHHPAWMRRSRYRPGKPSPFRHFGIRHTRAAK